MDNLEQKLPKKEMKKTKKDLEGLEKYLAEIKKLRKELEKQVVKRTEELEDSRVALMNMLEDIEEARKKAEEEKNKTLTIITNFTDGLLVFDREKKLSLINPQAEKFFEVKRKDVLRKPILELKIFPRFKPLVTFLGETIKKVYRKELIIKENLTLEASTLPMTTEREEIGTLIILHDITREKVVEKIKTEFVSLAAHKLRTPLSAIKWMLKMLLDGDLGEITLEQREFIRKTYQTNEEMINLINDLLNVTRIEEGKYLYKLALTDFKNVIQSVINSYQKEIKRKKLNLELKKPKIKLPKMVIDVEKTKLVVQNLLDNAIKYTLPGRKIKISLRHNKNKKEIFFSIKDAGVGIPEDQQPRVFSKFFRGENVMRMETKGSGLGLFIAKNIIEAQGGKIWFESTEGRGTTFHFVLPIQEEFGEFLKEF